MQARLWQARLGTNRALALIIAAGAACKGNPEVGIAIDIANAVAGKTEWYEIAAYRDATCAAVQPMLLAGLPDGFTARLAFKPSDNPKAPFGDIPKAKYAFAAVARDKDCAIIAVGCVETDVSDSDTVEVPTAAIDPPTGKCAVGATCQAGQCVPANDNADPSVGAACSLELLGAGPLANPVGGQGTVVSAPAIASTDSGFIIAYREIDPNGAGARITLLPIDDSGGSLPSFRPSLPNPCSNSDETDGVGLIVDKNVGLLALAKAPCGTKPELQLLTFDPTASPPGVGKFLVSPSPNDVKVTLGAARASARRVNGQTPENLVVFTEASTARIAKMDPAQGIVGVSPDGLPATFGGPNITDSWIAANDQVLALLAVGQGQVEQPQPFDAGADSGLPPLPVIDSGIESTLRLIIAAANADVTKLPPYKPNSQDATTNIAQVEFPGEWGLMAAQGGRILVMSDGTGPGRSVSYHAFDKGKGFNPSDTNGFVVEGTGIPTTGDVAISGDRAYFAVLKTGFVGLYVFNNATTTLTPLRSVAFNRETRISGMNIVRDGRVAVAATDTRVAVVWTATSMLQPNDTTGGYAVFACTR